MEHAPYGGPRDTGQNQLEYIGLVVLVAAIVAALVTSTVLTDIPRHFKAAICRVVGSDCPAASRPAAQPQQRKLPGWLPDKCLIRSNTRKKVDGVKVVAYRQSSKEATIIRRHSDGSITQITGDTKGRGVDIKLGYGVNYKGKGASITAGGSMMWNATKATKLTFDSPAQAKAFRRNVRDKAGSAVNSAYQDGLTGHDLPTMAELRKQVAFNMGIPHSRFSAHGTSGDAGFSGSYSVGSAGGAFQNSTSEGAWYNNKGTPHTRDDILTKSYMLSDKFTWDAGIGFSGSKQASKALQRFTAGARYYGDYVDGGTFRVRYKHDKPVKLILRRKRKWSHRTEAEVGAGPNSQSGGKKAGESSSGSLADSGGVSTEITTIDLRKDPAALPTFKRWLRLKRSGGPAQPPTNLSGPGVWKDHINWTHEWPQAKEAMARHIRQHGRTRRLNYARDRSESLGPKDVSASYWAEWFGAQDSTVRQRLSLEDAQYKDPSTGKWEPWVSCNQ